MRESPDSAYFGRVNRFFLAVGSLLLAAIAIQAIGQTPPTGMIVAKIQCSGSKEQSYALYLPTAFSFQRKWPILYLFDPGARGTSAVEAVRAAAEKYGYIVVGSNNSRNGLQGGSGDAAQAMWQDTQQRFPIDERRRYFGGMSGGARVASGMALNCKGCVAGVIANAAGFPPGWDPSTAKFVYFAAVGDSDFNYSEFVDLRPKLDAAGAKYQIRVFHGTHGWAPAEVWDEALNWMDMQAMAAGFLDRDQERIAKTMQSALDRARVYEEKKDLLSALREYQSIVRNLSTVADTSSAKNRIAALENDKEVRAGEKDERADIARQNRLMNDIGPQMEAIRSGDLNRGDVMQLRSKIADLKRDAEHSQSGREQFVLHRALGGLVVHAYESGQRSLEEKDYRSALQYFDLAIAGSGNAGWAHYQRARAFGGSGDKKQMLAELKLSASGGFHDVSALDAAEFTAYRELPEFRTIVDEWKKPSAD